MKNIKGVKGVEFMLRMSIIDRNTIKAHAQEEGMIMNKYLMKIIMDFINRKDNEDKVFLENHKKENEVKSFEIIKKIDRPLL